VSWELLSAGDNKIHFFLQDAGPETTLLSIRHLSASGLGQSGKIFTPIGQIFRHRHKSPCHVPYFFFEFLPRFFSGLAAGANISFNLLRNGAILAKKENKKKGGESS